MRKYRLSLVGILNLEGSNSLSSQRIILIQGPTNCEMGQGLHGYPEDQCGYNYVEQKRALHSS